MLDFINFRENAYSKLAIMFFKTNLKAYDGPKTFILIFGASFQLYLKSRYKYKYKYIITHI